MYIFSVLGCFVEDNYEYRPILSKFEFLGTIDKALYTTNTATSTDEYNIGFVYHESWEPTPQPSYSNEYWTLIMAMRVEGDTFDIDAATADDMYGFDNVIAVLLDDYVDDSIGWAVDLEYEHVDDQDHEFYIFDFDISFWGVCVCVCVWVYVINQHTI